MTTESEDKFNMMLPPEIRIKIMYYAIIGQEEPTLDYCRLVCRDWNEIIKRSVWQSPTKEWGAITKAMIENRWGVDRCYPSHKMISHAKDLEMGGKLPTAVMKTFAERVKQKISPISSTGIKKIEEKLYEKYKTMEFGVEEVKTLQLCAMMKTDPSGYYHVEHIGHLMSGW